MRKCKVAKKGPVENQPQDEILPHSAGLRQVGATTGSSLEYRKMLHGPLMKTNTGSCGLKNKRATIGLLVIGALAGLGYFARDARAQQQNGDIEVVPVKPNVYLIAGAGGNIVAQTGPDGVIVVDSGTTAMADKVLAAIKKLSNQPIRYIFNTSADAEHVGGNSILSKAGRTLYPLSDTIGGELGTEMTSGGDAPVLAAENVLLRMSAPTGKQAPFAQPLWPSETYNQKRKPFYLNGEAVEIIYQPAAHTDGDSIVFFRKSDVIAAGDVVDQTRFPAIDVDRGGSVQGELAALNRLVELAVPVTPFVWREGGTYTVPGHGRIMEQADLVEYRDMVTIVRDIVQDLIKQGMTLDQIKKAEPTKAYPQYAATSGLSSANGFVESIYKSLTGKK
jgi:cyclase